MKIYNSNTWKRANMNCLCKKIPKNKKICPIDNESIFFKSTCNIHDFDLSTKFWTQLSLNGNISFQRNKPLIGEIDSINAKVEILNKKVLKAPLSMSQIDFEGLKGGERIIRVYGLVCLSINYIGTLKNQQVFTFNDKIPFSATIDLPLNDSQRVDTLNFNYIISSCIEDIHINSIIDRHINVTVTFILSATKSFNKNDFCMAENYLEDSNIQCTEIKNCSNCDEENQIVFKGIFSQDKIEEILNIRKTQKYKKRFTSIEVLDIPRCNPNIVKILSVITNVKILCQKVIKTPNINRLNFENKRLTGVMLIVDFALHQTIKYSSSTSCESIHSATFNIPASFYITVPENTLLTDKFKISYYIDDIYACILNERQVFKSVSILFHAKPINCKENILNNIITFNGKDDKEVAMVRFNKDNTSLIVDSSGLEANSDFEDQVYFSLEIKDDSETIKYSSQVNGNQNADDFKSILNDQPFDYSDILTLNYKENTKVNISNFEGESNYNPSGDTESYEITPEGLKAIATVEGNVITIKGENSSVFSKINFDKINNKLIVTSTDNQLTPSFENVNALQLIFKNQRLATKNNLYVKGQEDSSNFRNTFNDNSFELGDILRFRYINTVSMLVSNYMGQRSYRAQNFSDSFVITNDGLAPANFDFLPNTIILNRGTNPKEIVVIDFAKKGLKLFVNPSGEEISNDNFKNKEYFRFILKERNGAIRQNQFIKGNQNAIEFSTALDEQRFNINQVLRLKYRERNKVTITNFNSQTDYNPKFYSERYRITVSGLELLPNRMLQNIITFKGQNNNEIVVLRFDMTEKIFIADSSGIKANEPLGETDYFSIILKESDNSEKLKSVVKGNEDGDNLSAIFDEKSFNFGDILTLTYNENTKVEITNLEGQEIYNPTGNTESYLITKDGLVPLKKLLQNIITFRGRGAGDIGSIDRIEMASVLFDKSTMKLIVTSSGKDSNTQGSSQYFAFTLLNSSGVPKNKAIVNANQNADGFANTLNEISFEYTDSITLEYIDASRVDITNFNGEIVYHPNGSTESYNITSTGLVKKL